MSPADERLRGYRAEEVIGRHVTEVLTDEGIAILRRKQECAQKPSGAAQEPGSAASNCRSAAGTAG
ncbi:PAS domain S-box protein [Candidatus Accumulibacter sp. ACC007]|uniref:PAS domain S-box protein n=1 Tax=Candidatus Accumulibacter sp. ACC007 TaxID=2823333 RepID=UPI003422B750